VLLTGKVKEAVTRTEADGHLAYDAVVLDAPPTGRIARFLEATREVAGLTRIGPINRQSEGVIALLHGRQTRVHLVTLLEEMPVQETLDAAAELGGLGYHLGTVIVNRARPALVHADQLGPDGVDVKLLAAGLRKIRVPVAHAAPLAREVAAYAQRQETQQHNARRLDEVDVPRIRLPDLNPPVELGELTDLAAHFAEEPA
jgi:anion-transporting  ArsA/GET3 family ATPase